MEQVQAARQRREREVQRQERERRRNNQLMAEQEAKRAAEEKRQLKENRKWLAQVGIYLSVPCIMLGAERQSLLLVGQVARTNQENMKAAHKKMLAELAQERGLSKVWQAQLDAQDKRRKEEFEAMCMLCRTVQCMYTLYGVTELPALSCRYARGDKSAAFGEMLNIDPEAKAREDEARAEKWQRVQIAREERKARQKEERARRLVQDQQRALKAQMEHEAQLRRKALAEEMELQKTLIAMDKVCSPSRPVSLASHVGANLCALAAESGRG